MKLPRIGHAVLQRDMVVPVWGWADAGEEVTVSLGDQNKTTKADADGKWQVRFEKLSAGGPHTLTVKGKNTLTVNDVLVGEVWLASGQSNMAMSVGASRDPAKEKASANFPQLRMFSVPRTVSREPQADCRGAWKVCSRDTVAEFSATAYFFGRDLHQVLAVSVDSSILRSAARHRIVDQPRREIQFAVERTAGRISARRNSIRPSGGQV